MIGLMDDGPSGGWSRHQLTTRWARPLAAGLVAAGLVVLGGAIVTWLTGGMAWGFDFIAYYDAANRLASTGSPYAPETLSGPFSPTEYGLYLYSPLPAALFQPLTVLPFDAAVTAWLVIRLAGLAIACGLMPVSVTIRVATFGVAALSWPVLHDLGLGNISVVITLLLVVAWRWLDRPAAAVALAGATLLRPTAAVTYVWLLGRRAWRPLIWTLGATVGLIGFTLLFAQPGSWVDYITLLRNVTGVLGVRQNADLGSAVVHLGGPDWLAQLALIAGIAIAIGSILVSLRRDRETSYVVTVVAMLFLSPVLWSHYLAQLLIPAAFLAGRGRPWALAIPLLCWLPMPLLPFLTLGVLALTVLAPDARRWTPARDGGVPNRPTAAPMPS